MTKRYWARTLSANVMTGNESRVFGLLDGDVLWPLPKSAGTMMKYFDGLSDWRVSEITEAVSWMTI